jgi:hypothetical protein
MKWAENVSRMRKQRNLYRLSVGKPEGKWQLEEPICRWEDKIKTGVKAIAWSGIDWIDLSNDRDQWRVLMNTIMNPQIPLNFLSSSKTVQLAAFQETLSYIKQIWLSKVNLCLMYNLSLKIKLCCPKKTREINFITSLNISSVKGKRLWRSVEF